MTINIRFNDPTSIFFHQPKNEPFHVKLGHLADELFYLGNHRVSIIVDKEQIIQKPEMDSTPVYLKSLALKVSIIAILLIPLTFKKLYGALLPLVMLSAKIFYKYRYLPQVVSQAEKEIEKEKIEMTEKKKQKEESIVKDDLDQEEVEKETASKLVIAKEISVKFEPLINRLKSAHRLLPTEVDAIPSVFWKHETEKMGVSNYRKTLPLDKFKAKFLYVIIIKDNYFFLEWQTNRSDKKLDKKNNYTNRIYLKQEASEGPKGVCSIKERAIKRVIADKEAQKYLCYEMQFGDTKKKLLKYPHLTLDNRRTYDLEGAFHPDDELEIWEVNETSTKVFKEKWSNLEDAKAEEEEQEVNPGIKGWYEDLEKVKGKNFEEHLNFLTKFNTSIKD